MTLPPGVMAPLGATYDGVGVNFAVFSEAADHIEVCLLDEDGHETRHVLPERTAFVHHGYVPGLVPGQQYGFRAHGRWAPNEGVLCNPAKLLIDPYARAITGPIDWGPAVYGSVAGAPDVADPIDSAPHMPRSVIVENGFDWGNDRPPATPLHETVIYETHVRGMTAQHRDVPPELRGTYAGLVCEPVLDHLVTLGITAIELMPIHHFVSEHSVVERGLTNYWGYNSIGYFAPHGAYAAAGDSGRQVNEFKAMVKAFHEAGIEVILDVVYNHTAEGNHLGPLLSLKGLDNRAYYRLDPDDPTRYVDFTGTGNSLNMRHSQTLQLMMDSLRYWITEMHVDGFRFDLAAALARGLHEVDRLSSFFDLIHQDPVVSRVKLIAEPWDVGDGGYQVGNFPPLWSEWNGKYRDEVRDYWRGQDGSLGDLALRLTGSSDLYAWSGRRPSASINFVTAHDGFTLADLVSYDHKHNEANGEENRDGDDHNRSWNSGAEGPTDDPAVCRIRETRRRSLLATLFLSQGVPMLSGGDELGRSQHGNNNGYAQDNEVSWFDWHNVDHDLLDFVRRLIAIRTAHPVLHRRRWFEGRPIHGAEAEDIGWFTRGGSEMSEDDWQMHAARALTVFMNGMAIKGIGPRGEQVVDDSFLILFNAKPQPTEFVLPPLVGPGDWSVELDTSTEQVEAGEPTTGPWEAAPWSVLLLRRPLPAESS